MQGIRDLRIQLFWRRLEGLHPKDPTPDQIEFWQWRDPRTGSDVQHVYRFADDMIERELLGRRDSWHDPQLPRRCIVYGATVLWSEVAVVFLTDAQLKLPEAVTETEALPAHDMPSSQEPERSSRRKVGRPFALTPEEINAGKVMVHKVDQKHRRQHGGRKLKISSALHLLRDKLKREGKPILVSDTVLKEQIVWPVLRPEKT
jgi:hypothetical protein